MTQCFPGVVCAGCKSVAHHVGFHSPSTGPISKQCRPVEGLWDLTNMELSVPPTVAINTARAEWLLIASTSLLWSLEASKDSMSLPVQPRGPWVWAVY